MASLVVKIGRNIGKEYKLKEGRNAVGRRSICEVPVADPKASREHAAVYVEGSKVEVEDLSRNGILLNGRRVSRGGRTVVKFGDRIRLGDTELELVDESQEALKLEIPGYKILDRIGRGGMGTVFKARQLSMDRLVALKVLEEKYSTNREFVERFIREARAAGKLNHPNVIHVHDVSRTGNRHYFSMEYVDGHTIKELLRREKQFSVDKALDVVMQAAKALEFAHENGIVHRDVKPDNLMVTRDGIVKIADLGIAKLFNDSPVKDSRRVMGTPHYMAPEQALGKAVDHRTDIYSLGATFYQVLTGHTPFSGATSRDILKAHIHESLSPIQSFNPEVPTPVCFIVERMMAKLPDKRYPDMTSLIADLEKAQRGASEGIERLEAGASSVMQTAGEGEGGGARKAVAVRRRATEEIGTGVQSPLRRYLFSALWTIVFCVALSGTIWFLQNRDNQTGANRPTTQPKTGGSGNQGEKTPGEEKTGPEEPQAPKLLQQARTLLEADRNSSAAEAVLRRLVNDFPTAPEAEEAKKLLTTMVERQRRAKLGRWEGMLKDARNLLEENPPRYEQALKLYREVRTAATGTVPEMVSRADEAIKALEKRRTAEAAKTAEAAFAAAQTKAEEALRNSNYDAARKVWRDFIAAYGGSSKKADADAKLKAVEAMAATTFKTTVAKALAAEKRPRAPLPAAVAVWDEWLAYVKDEPRRKTAEQNRKALEIRLKNFFDSEQAAVAERARLFRYEEALDRCRAAREKLGSTAWSKKIAAREEQLQAVKRLHEEIVAAIKQRIRENGPVPVTFPFVVPKMEEVKQWAIAGVNGERLDFEALPKGSGPGVPRRFADLKPVEQYLVYRMFLPRKLTAEQQKALAVFRADRGLAPIVTPKKK